MREKILLAFGLMFANMLALAPAAERTLQIGSRKQLFVDEALIARKENVQLTMNRPAKDPAPFFLKGGLQWALYNAVLQDGDLIRLYYTAAFAGKMRIAYAESKDGVNWTCPNLGLVTLDGSTSNNVVFPLVEDPAASWLQLEGGGVIIDKNPACLPEQKYKMFLSWGGPDNKKAGTWVLGSPDGLHWKPISDKPSFRSSDTGNHAWWEEGLGRYVAYVRVWGPKPPQRKICRCEFDDLKDWGKEKVVLEVDDQDGGEVDLYTNAGMEYEGIHFVFPSMHAYRRDFILLPKDAAEAPAGKKQVGAWDVQMASSRNHGRTWTRLDRRPFVPLGSYREWDSGMISMFGGVVVTDDEIWMYYWGRKYPHFSQFENKDRPEKTGFGRVRLRRDGFVSADAAYTGGELTTVPFTFTGQRLELNFETGVGGSLKVELQDAGDKPIPGFGLETVDELYGNFVRKAVTWSGKDTVQALAGKPVRLRFVMRDAKLYAFQFAQ